MSNYPKIFKVYFPVRNLNRGTYISAEFNQARNLTEFLFDFFLFGGKKLQLNGHVTDKLLRHFENEKGTGAKMRPAVLSGIVPGDVPLSYWPFFFKSQKSLQKLTRPRFLSKVKKEEGEDFLFRLTFLHP